MVCENIFTAPPRPNSCRWCFQSSNRLYYNFFGDLNLEGHPNCITSSKVTAIFLNRWILSIGGASSGRVCACILRSRLVYLGVCRTAPVTPGLLIIIIEISLTSCSTNICKTDNFRLHLKF